MSNSRGRIRHAAAALTAIFLLAATAAALSACNTTAGFGRDVSATGQAVSSGANKVKQGM
jgi:predicted small secreted protein